MRLHDDALTPEEIAHNFKGGISLGTEIHDWWRTEPDKWWTKESKHFRHCVDEEEMRQWSSQQLKEFNERVPGMFDLAELIYHLYSERLAMRSSVVSVKPELRGDGIKYSVPIQPCRGSFMGFDGNFGWACQEAGFINPHELVHGWQAMTGGMTGHFWETHANFPQTYAGIYQTMPLSMKESSLYPCNGRTYYADRSFFEHLAQTPEYGPMFISKLWYDGPAKVGESPSPWTAFQRVNPYPERSFADEYGRMAMRNVTWDYQTFKECMSLANYGRGPQPAEENRYRKAAEALKKEVHQPYYRSRVLLEPIAYEPQWWRVPKQQAPQQLGWNVCPLTCDPGRVSATLKGYVDAGRGGDWRAGFVGVDVSGKPVYGELFGPGKTTSFEVNANIRELYLVVAATPSKIMDIDLASDYRSVEQEQFPYKVQLAGCQPLNVMLPQKPEVGGSKHPNGGGFVESSAKVDATAFVAPNARVLGDSKVLGNARLEDCATVRDSTVKDQALLSGHALVCEQSTVSGNAKVRDFAVVRGRTTVTGNAKLLEHAIIDTAMTCPKGKTCSDNVVIKGLSYVYGGSQSGSAMIDGFYAKSNEITGGKWFTWSWGQGKNPGEEETSFGGLYADYDFNQPHGWMARDAFGATWGYLINSPRFEPRAGRLGGKPDGVLRLNGRDQFVELQKDVADFADCTYTAEVFWDGATDGTRIFEFANASGDFVCLTPSLNGKMILALRKGPALETVIAPALARNVWTTVQVIFSGNVAGLYINGKKAGERTGMKLRPESIGATQCYLGRGAKAGFFGGAIGRFTIHSAALIDRTPPTPNPPVFELAPMLSSPRSVLMSAKRGSDPLEVIEYWFEQVGGTWNSAWTKEPNVQIEVGNSSVQGLYRFKMRDKCGNQTQYSQPAKAAVYSGPLFEVTPQRPTVMEAESFAINTRATDGSGQWEKQTDPAGFVGEGAMAVPDRGKLHEAFTPSAARLDYSLNFASPGRYFLWVRATGNNDGGQSIYAGLGLKLEDWGRNLRTGFGRYAWTRSPAFKVKEAGPYLFSIWMREDGAMVDRFVITGSEAFEPAPQERAADGVMIGKGPAESTPLSAR